MNKQMLDLYTDYLISSFSYTTATGLASMTNDVISHDQVTRFLSKETYDSKDLWQLVKSTVRKIESEEGILSLDDTIQEKPYTDENEIIAWHYDHTEGRAVKGVNILNCIYTINDINIPVAFEVIRKTEEYTDSKTGKVKKKAEKSKNEMMREMIRTCIHNQIKFKTVLSDIWFGSTENMSFVKEKMKKEFIFAMKSNRTLASSKQDKLNGKFQRIDSLDMQEGQTYTVYLKGLSFPVLVMKQVFKNKDGSEGELYLACSDLSLDFDQIKTLYQKRWNIETYHKSIKSNTGLAKSPTKTVRTQSNHFFMSIYAYFKLELLKIKTKCNHFALKSKLYIHALQASFTRLQELSA